MINEKRIEELKHTYSNKSLPDLQKELFLSQFGQIDPDQLNVLQLEVAKRTGSPEVNELFKIKEDLKTTLEIPQIIDFNTLNRTDIKNHLNKALELKAKTTDIAKINLKNEEISKIQELIRLKEDESRKSKDKDLEEDKKPVVKPEGFETAVSGAFDLLSKAFDKEEDEFNQGEYDITKDYEQFRIEIQPKEDTNIKLNLAFKDGKRVDCEFQDRSKVKVSFYYTSPDSIPELTSKTNKKFDRAVDMLIGRIISAESDVAFKRASSPIEGSSTYESKTGKIENELKDLNTKKNKAELELKTLMSDPSNAEYQNKLDNINKLIKDEHTKKFLEDFISKNEKLDPFQLIAEAMDANKKLIKEFEAEVNADIVTREAKTNKLLDAIKTSNSSTKVNTLWKMIEESKVFGNSFDYKIDAPENKKIISALEILYTKDKHPLHAKIFNALEAAGFAKYPKVLEYIQKSGSFDSNSFNQKFFNESVTKTTKVTVSKDEHDYIKESDSLLKPFKETLNKLKDNYQMKEDTKTKDDHKKNTEFTKNKQNLVTKVSELVKDIEEVSNPFNADLLKYMKSKSVSDVKPQTHPQIRSKNDITKYNSSLKKHINDVKKVINLAEKQEGISEDGKKALEEFGKHINEMESALAKVEKIYEAHDYKVGSISAPNQLMEPTEYLKCLGDVCELEHM